MQQGIPEPESSKDAVTGDRIHAALAGRIPPAELTGEEREVFDMCREDERKAAERYFGDTPIIKVIREERFWAQFQANGSTLVHSGAVDVCYRAQVKALVIDYKTGRNEVAESPRNLQLRDYAVLTRGNLVPVAEVATAIVQPFVTRDPVLCTYDREALNRAEKEMFDRVTASNVPGQPRSSGEEQCKFCKAKRLCPEYQKWAGLMTPPAMLQVLEVPMANWTPEQRATAANALRPAKKLLDDLEQFIKEGLAKDATFCPGFHLGKPKKLESITDPTECFKRFTQLGGSQEQFMETIKVGKTKLKDALRTVTGAKGKTLDAALDKLTEGIVETKYSEAPLEKDSE